MSGWLNKEHIVRKKTWVIALEVLIDTILIAALIYLCITKYNSDIVKLLTEINNKKIGFSFLVMIFPAIFILVGIIKSCFYLGNTNTPSKQVKKKK